MSHKILLVEDDKTTIFLLNKFIRDLGYHIIHVVPTGEQAIHDIIKFNPDVVLMDIVLEGQIDGIETARQINDIHSIPVIFITSSSDSTTLKRALTTNPSGYIVKPVDKKELKSAIELAILRHEMEDRLKESELRFFTILNSIGDAVFVMDTADQITYVNPNAERITELTIDNLIGKRFNEVMNIHYNGLTGGTDVLNDEIHYNYFISPSGKKVPVDFSVSPISDITGERAGSVIIMRDDTERVNSEMKLKESFVQIKKAVSGIIQAMAQTLETRDPYTAGH